MVAAMKHEDEEWKAEYKAAVTDAEKAAVILAAADRELRDGSAVKVAGILAGWLQDIADTHPLCRKQQSGLSMTAFQYRDRPFRGPSDKWTHAELAALSA